MKKEKSITDLINLSKLEKKKTNQGKNAEPKKRIKAESRKMKRKTIRPNNSRFISPFECLQSILKKYDANVPDNIHLMCISFILKCTEENIIQGNSCADIMTNHIFTKRKKRKNNKNNEMDGQEMVMHELEDNVAYHLQCEEQLPLFGLVLDPRQCMLKNSMDKQFTIKLFNFNSEEVILHPNTNICKIFIYALKRSTMEHQGN